MIRKTDGGILITRIKQLQGRIFEKLLTAHGISEFNGAQGRILFVLWEQDGIDQRAGPKNRPCQNHPDKYAGPHGTTGAD